MVKKINKDKKKITKNKKKKSAEIVNFINKYKTNNKIKTEQMKAKRTWLIQSVLGFTFENLDELSLKKTLTKLF